MNKGELINQIAADAGISKTEASASLNAVIENITNSLREGDKVTLVGFGTFSISERAARTGRNPQTGAEIQIEAKKVVRFKAGKEFAEAV